MDFKSVVSLLKGFCVKEMMNEADRVFDSMIEKNHKPDGTAYNVMIHGHCRGGDVRKAYRLYKEMVSCGFLVHTVTAIALVKAFHKEGMVDELSSVIDNVLRSCELSEAEQAKVLVEINHREGNMDVVLDVLAEMAKDGFLPNTRRQ